MKNLLYKFATVAAIVALGSCNFIDPELNIDPNNPDDATMELLFPAATAMYAYVLGGDYGRYNTIYTQHHGGSERQHTSYDVYGLNESDVNRAWNNLYAISLMDLRIIQDKAEESKSPHFSGVSKIMTAMILATLVDVNDDIPYSTALQGEANEGLKPTYDTGAEVYAEIVNLLNGAIADLGSAESTFSPASNGGDLVYGGDLASWIAAANSLKARYAVRLSEVSSTAYDDALAAIDAGAIADNSGDALFYFASGATEANPWFQFDRDRGDVNMGAFFIDLMVSIDDPRLPVFASKVDTLPWMGMTAGLPDNSPNIARFGSAYGSAASPVPFITYAETKFLEAEAALGTGDAARAAAAHNEAITASCAAFGVSDADYLAAQASEDENSITLEKILTHKYIALYTTQEPYNDFRRKGIPALTPAIGQSKIAVRFPYPSGERLYNADNFPGLPDVFNDNVFWDVD